MTDTTFDLPKSGKATWTELKPTKAPISRSSHGVTYNSQDNSTYVYGGEHLARHSIDSVVWKFSNNEWTEQATTGDAPPPMVAHAQIIQNNVLWIWGGREGELVGNGDLDNLYKLDLVSLKWETVQAKGDMPRPRSFHQMCEAQGKLHLFGGCAGSDRLADLHTLDLETLVWTQQPSHDAIIGRGGCGFVAHGHNLFVIAGYCGAQSNTCYKFDLEKKSWTTIPSDNLRPRSVFGICTVGNHVVVLGGEIEDSKYGHLGAGVFSDDLVTMNVETLKFGELEQNLRPVGRGWTRLTATGNDSFLLFGGLAGTDEEPNRLNDTWECKLEF